MINRDKKNILAVLILTRMEQLTRLSKGDTAG